MRAEWSLQSFPYRYHAHRIVTSAQGFPPGEEDSVSAITVNAGDGAIEDFTLDPVTACTPAHHGFRVTRRWAGTDYVFDTLRGSGLPYLDSISGTSASSTFAGGSFSFKEFAVTVMRLSSYTGVITIAMASNATEDGEGGPAVGSPIGIGSPFAISNQPVLKNLWDGAKARYTSFNSAFHLQQSAALKTGHVVCAFPIESADTRPVYSHTFAASYEGQTAGGDGTGPNDQFYTSDGEYTTLDANGSASNSEPDETRQPILFKISNARLSLVPAPANPGCRKCARAFYVFCRYGSPLNLTIADGIFVQECLTPTQVAGLTTAQRRTLYPYTCSWRTASGPLQRLRRIGPMLWELTSLGGESFPPGGAGATYLKSNRGDPCPTGIIEGLARLERDGVGAGYEVIVVPELTITAVTPPVDHICYCEQCRDCTSMNATFALKLTSGETSMSTVCTRTQANPCKYAIGGGGTIDFVAAAGTEPDHYKLTLPDDQLVATLACNYDTDKPILSALWTKVSGSLEVDAIETL